MTNSKCIVPNCNSGYSSCKEKVTLLSVPKSTELIKQWQSAIPRKDFVVKPGQVVCHKHFLPEDVVWKKEVKDPSGKVIASEDLRRPYLKPGRIPGIFPNCPSYLSKNTKKRKSPKKRNLIVESNNSKRRKIFDSIEHQIPQIANDFENNNIPQNVNNSNNLENKILETDSPVDFDQHENKKEREALFNFIFQNKDSLIIPVSWNRRQSNEGHFEAIELTRVITRRVDNKLLFVSSRQLIIYQDLGVEVKTMGTNLDLKSIDFENEYVSSTEEIENLVNRLDEAQICIGCASPSSKKNFESSFAFHDSEGRLRHGKCSLIVPKSEKPGKFLRCQSCKTGRKALTNKALRLKKRGEYKRILLNLSPNNKMKLEKLKKKCKNVRQQKIHFESLYNHYKHELGKLQDQMANFDDKNLSNKLSNLKIHKNERTVISEILNASKCKSTKGRRYSEDWILLCLLFHMRSPAAYRLLRENSILPLPCTSTIRRYLSLMDTPCRFDDNFLKLFSKSFANKPDIYRHGLLSFDEIATRKEVRLDHKTMKILGLTDYGDNKDINVSEKADHGLVFMFQPLQGSFVQPVAVCVSKGPACGITIAKLVIQAISVLEKAGAIIHGVVSDGSAPNRKFWKEMGISGKINDVQNWFPHPTMLNRKIYVFSDTPHLIKCVRNRLHDKKELKLDANNSLVKWEYFTKLYDQDRYNITGKWCPKITPSHLQLNSMLKMRVSLAVQVLSKSMATGLLKAKSFYPSDFGNCETTAEFCLKFNDLFDALNRTKNGLTVGCRDFTVLEEFLVWLDAWEQKLISGILVPSDILTNGTNEGLRVTINSAIQLSNELLKSFKFDEVFTGNINQDPLERFFGTIRLAGGTNDHPTTPTFLQLYKILSAYSLLKPPKLGNCTPTNDDPPEPLITISELKELYKSKNKSCFEEIKSKLKVVVEDVHSDFSDFIKVTSEHDYAMPELLDCLFFYNGKRVSIC